MRTLARRAAEATNPRQAALLRKEAATLRRAERARAAAKKPAKKTAKQTGAAKQRIAAGAREALDLAVYMHQAVWRAEGPARRRRMCRLRNHALDLAQELLEEVSRG